MKKWLESFYASLKQEMPGLKVSMQKHPKSEEEHVEIHVRDWKPLKRGWTLELMIHYFPGLENATNKSIDWASRLEKTIRKMFLKSSTGAMVRSISLLHKPTRAEGWLCFKHSIGENA
jgi:hypothetical protein